jgi:hypothetical protein
MIHFALSGDSRFFILSPDTLREARRLPHFFPALHKNQHHCRLTPQPIFLGVVARIERKRNPGEGSEFFSAAPDFASLNPGYSRIFRRLTR